MTLNFYNHQFCPFAQRIWIILQLAHIQYHMIHVTLAKGKKQEFFTRIYQQSIAHDPLSDGRVPIIQDQGFKLTESQLIGQYLIQKYKLNKFIPSSFDQKFKMKALIRSFPMIISSFYSALFKRNQESLKKLRKSLRLIQQWLDKNGSQFLIVNNVCYADILLWPFINRISIVKQIIGENILKEFPQLSRWDGLMKDICRKTDMGKDYYYNYFKTMFLK